MPNGRAQAPGPRSLELLEFVARLDVAAVGALQCAFALRRSATYSHLQRLHDAELVSRLYSHGHGAAVAVTRRGRHHLALPAADVPVRANTRPADSGVLVAMNQNSPLQGAVKIPTHF